MPKVEGCRRREINKRGWKDVTIGAIQIGGVFDKLRILITEGAEIKRVISSWRLPSH